MIRRHFLLFSVVVLPVCGAMCALWVHREKSPSRRPPVVAATSAVPQLPPATRPAGPPATGQHLTEAEQLVSEIRNSQVTWGVERVLNRPHEGELISMEGMPVHGPAKYVADEIALHAHERGPALEQLTSALLRAMDDPDRFVAAHVILCHQSYMLRDSDGRWIRNGRFEITKEPNGSFIYVYDNLRVRLKPQADEWTGHDGDDDIVGWYCTASVDTAQMKMIKEQWQSRLARKSGGSKNGRFLEW